MACLLRSGTYGPQQLPVEGAGGKGISGQAQAQVLQCTAKEV